MTGTSGRRTVRVLHQLLSIIGALLVLGAYAGNLMHRLERDGTWYAGLNVVGAGLLSYVAWYSATAGIILIEVSWALISLVALIRAARRRLRQLGARDDVRHRGPAGGW